MMRNKSPINSDVKRKDVMDADCLQTQESRGRRVDIGLSLNWQVKRFVGGGFLRL